MPLKEPPDYVALDPALVYGVHDLKRETYQRLLQLIGWMYVTRKSGNPLGATIKNLAERWGIAERSVYHTLKVLADKGYIEVSYRGGWAYITKGPSCTNYNNTPGEPATEETQQQAARGDNMESRASSLHENAPSLHENSRKLRSPNTNSSVVVVGSPSEEILLQQQLTTISPAQSAMQQAGMFADKAQDLATDPWVTVARVDAWVERLEQDPTIRNVAAVLYANLKNHREPPHPRVEEDSRRFIKGKYAAYIAH